MGGKGGGGGVLHLLFNATNLLFANRGQGKKKKIK